MAIKTGEFEASDGRIEEREFVECDVCGEYALELIPLANVDPDAEHLCQICNLHRCPRCHKFSPDFPDICPPCHEFEAMRAGL
jgi:hypothetical protein